MSGSGKTTISQAIEKKLRAAGAKLEVLDGDIVRTNLTRVWALAKKIATKNVRRIGFVSHLLTRNGVIVLVSAISPYRAVRDQVRQRIGDFIEVYANTPVEVCEERDVKGLYKKARSGEILNFTGISDPYEEPLNPEVNCETVNETLEESANKVMAKLEELGYLSPVAV